MRVSQQERRQCVCLLQCPENPIKLLILRVIKSGDVLVLSLTYITTFRRPHFASVDWF
jgi:hypothetical protein